MQDEPQTPAVGVHEVSKSFGKGGTEVRVLSQVSVEIGQREFFTLLGPSGCGKTTLLRLIAGFETVTSGEITIDGRVVNDLPPFHRPVNTVFQNYALFPHMTVEQNIAFAMEMAGKSRRDIRQRVGETLEMVRMGQFAKRKPSELSGGQQQRVALARALAPRPKVLLLDEPLSALDLKLRKQMQIELKELQHEAGITFVFVTHDQEEALALSDRVAVMHGGKILQLGAPRDIYENPQHHFVADFIGDINLLAGKALDQGNVRLDCGVVLAIPNDLTRGASLSVAIRPERARLAARGSGTLDATLTGTSFLGTSVLHQFQLADGTNFLLREAETASAAAAPGASVGLELPIEALKVFAS